MHVHTYICISKMRFSVPLMNLPMTIVLQIMVLQWASDCIDFAVVCLGKPQMPIALKKYTWEFHVLYQHIFPKKAILIQKKSDFLFLLFFSQFPMVSCAT